MKDIPLWQKLYDEYQHENSYQGKLEKENDKLKAKLARIQQVVDDVQIDKTITKAIAFDKIRRILKK